MEECRRCQERGDVKYMRENQKEMDEKEERQAEKMRGKERIDRKNEESQNRWSQ